MCVNIIFGVELFIAVIYNGVLSSCDIATCLTDICLRVITYHKEILRYLVLGVLSVENSCIPDVKSTRRFIIFRDIY